MPSEGRFRLARLEAAGFRGVNRPLALTFGPGLTLLFGRNGTGKSSLLEAVAWALFGGVGAPGGPEFRREDALVNAFATESRAVVRLTLERAGETLTVERRRKLGRSTTERSELMVASGGERWRDEAATAALARRLGLDAAAFNAAVLLRQDTLRSLAGSSDAERAAAIDRLLGLDRLRALLDGLPLAPVAREAARLTRAAAAEEATGLGSAISVRRLVAEREAALVARGRSPADLAAPAFDAALARVAAGLAALGFAPPAPTNGARSQRLAAAQQALAAATQRRDAHLADAHRQRARLAEALARLEQEAGGDGETADALTAEATALGEHLASLDARLDAASTRLAALRRLADDAEAAAAALGEAEDRRAALVAQHGDAAALAATLQTLGRELDDLTAQGRRQRARAQLLNDALEALSERGATTCPVCGSAVDHEHLLAHLRAAVASRRDARQLEELRDHFRQADARRRAGQEAQAALAAAEEEVAARRARRDEVDALLDHHRETADAADAPATLIRQAEAERLTVERERRDVADRLRAVAAKQAAAQRQHAAAASALATLRGALAAPPALPLPALVQRARERQREDEAAVGRLEAAGAQLAALGAALADAGAVGEYLDLRDAARRLEAEGEASAAGKLLTARDRLLALQTALEQIHAAVEAEAAAAREQRLAELLPAINARFRQLGGHPAYGALSLHAEEGRAGALYWLRAHTAEGEQATLLSTRFSTTQRLVAALSIFFTLAAALPHALDCLLLDDPAQSMDAGRQAALASLLAEEARTRQVLVATEDEGFRAALDQALDGRLTVLTLGEWGQAGVRLADA